MQQDASEQSGFPWQDALGDASLCLPFRCPRCGERSRFRSLSALRAHLEYGHGYEERSAPPKGGPPSPRKGAGPASPPEPCGPGSATRYPTCAGFCDASSGSAEGRRALEAERGPVCCLASYAPAGSPGSRLSSPGLPAADSKASFEAHVREKFNRMVEAVDKTIEKRIDKLTKELAQKTAELLEVRAAFVQLSQKKQEVQRRERALSRQVDVAVEMIAALKQRLTESEEELHRKEEEVVTFNHFLEEAAEKEVRGKARLQHFIENLLQRVDLAERQLEYYQNQQIACNHTGGTDHVFTDISLNKKPRCLSRGSQHASYNIPDTKPHSFQKGRVLLKKAKEEKTSLQPVRCFYEPVDCPREIWRAQKKGEPVCSARKVSAKSKMGKKTKQL
ncbi:protein ZNF365 [Numida meleagris]|uniref:protein ZNF365 n=1 Tax=Numida meleagris TaxID=8996 RepID=UPI000B3E04D2|nr:protein ZNF365 [Numida meleagris]